MSVFAVEFGGERSGVLVAFIDAAGYASAAAFSFIAGAVADREGGWVLFMGLLFVFSCLAFLSTVWFLYLDYRAHQGSAGGGRRVR